ncbi:anti-anti-sigma factor [Spinactinospora alkalitolerans]|uniref:Anti-sigma factor antagonist n=1 Tax=Spinactinospora alkalitolerans TaxID=687207 RepID=A0A852TTS3_9ACTN|nr:STAS domain-containing protein [Spinactinospora alkalitolerans]NYE46252.1 anti-anti-sigma factor [Spinactinospora alkalitolerans]
MRIAASLPVRQHGRHLVITLPAEIDVCNRDEILDQLLPLLNSGPGSLVLDMSDTTFCDSAGVNLLIRIRHRARLLKRDVCVVAPHGAVRRVFEICGLDRALKIHRDPAGLPS